MVERATFAAGCFWGVEARFREVLGVLSTKVGYIGGHTDEPSYEDVCTGQTGHAEAVDLEFDPSVVTFEGLLAVFWHCHNPTTLNRQGPDVGTQYRSAIFCHSPEQTRLAETSRAQAQSRFQAAIVTEVVPAAAFWPAEDYHQQYYERRGMAAVCHT